MEQPHTIHGGEGVTMRCRTKIIIVLMLLLSVCFAGVGYASLTDELSLEGELIVVVPEFDQVIIQSIDSVSATGSAAAALEQAWQVLPTNLVSTQRFSAVGETVTYTMTAVNQSDTIKYAFSQVTCDAAAQGYDNAYYDNGLSVTVTAQGYDLSAGIEPGGTLVLTAAYTLTDASLVGQELKTMLNYKFGVHVESAGDAVINTSAQQFENIINAPEALSTLQNLMAGNAGNSQTGGYVGNVAGNDSEDSAIINELFTDGNGNNMLTLVTTDGTKTDVTCLIKSEQVTVGGLTKDAMVIYMTAEEITGSLFNPSDLTVYALVYVPGTTQEWVPLGEMYVGTAQSNNYEGSFFGTHNSFNTDTWETSAHTYTAGDASYSYSLQAGMSIDQVLSQGCTELAWAAFERYQSMAEAIDLDNYADGEAKDALLYARQHARKLTEQGMGGTTQAEAVVVISQLENAIKPFQA